MPSRLADAASAAPASRPSRLEAHASLLEDFTGMRRPRKTGSATVRTIWRKMVRPERFELPTYSSGGCRSIQLSYGRTPVFPVYMRSFTPSIRLDRKSASGQTEPDAERNSLTCGPSLSSDYDRRRRHRVRRRGHHDHDRRLLRLHRRARPWDALH
jgi:hypothetical protein